MKVRVAKKDLDQALAVVSHSMSAGGGDLTAHYLFRVSPTDPEKLEVLTSSARLFSGYPLVAEIHVDDGEPTAFSIEGFRLKQWLSAVDGTVSFTYEEGVVTAEVPMGAQKFQSLNAKDYPYWDGLLKQASHQWKVAARRLVAALDFTRHMASDQETKQPKLCVCEVQDGRLSATDQMVAAQVKMEEMDGSSLRLHVKDAPNVLAFLATVEDDDVIEVLEHDRNAFFRRSDGAVLGATRYTESFRKLNLIDEAPQRSWKLREQDLTRALPFLMSGASKEDDRVYFGLPREQDMALSVSMVNMSGQKIAVDVGCEEISQRDDIEFPDLPPNGFILSYPRLLKLISPYTENGTIRFGVNRIEKPDGRKHGYIQFEITRFAQEDGTGGDRYITYLAWHR